MLREIVSNPMMMLLSQAKEKPPLVKEFRKRFAIEMAADGLNNTPQPREGDRIEDGVRG